MRTNDPRNTHIYDPNLIIATAKEIAERSEYIFIGLTISNMLEFHDAAQNLFPDMQRLYITYDRWQAEELFELLLSDEFLEGKHLTKKHQRSATALYVGEIYYLYILFKLEKP